MAPLLHDSTGQHQTVPKAALPALEGCRQRGSYCAAGVPLAPAPLCAAHLRGHGVKAGLLTWHIPTAPLGVGVVSAKPLLAEWLLQCYWDC